MGEQGRDLDYGCRSLLQKAVRRGQVELVRRVAWHLWQEGFQEWLRTRTAVILAEECWPLLGLMEPKAEIGEILDWLTQATMAVKEKDAGALEGLAGWVESGEEVTLSAPSRATVDEFRAKSGAGFWEWALQNAQNEEQAKGVVAAEKLSHRGEGGLAQAAAWLGLQQGVPEVVAAPERLALPLWVGLDKHTGQGKRALETGAWNAGVGLEQALRVSFWVEGVRCNQLQESELWREHKRLALAEAGLDEAGAGALWRKLQPHFLSALRGDLAAFSSHIESLVEPVLVEETKQLGFF
jgi:hypothetical protein